MATNSMAYDDPVYRARILIPARNTAGASWVAGGFTPFTSMIAKSIQIAVVTAGTGTGNATVQVNRIAAGGTAITTLGVTTMGTSSAGVTSNVTLGSTTLTAGDIITIVGGADATAVYNMGIELSIVPGATVTT